MVEDIASGSQRLLQGHRSEIECTAAGADGRWLVTADTGEDAMLIVWDAMTGVPLKTLFLGAEAAAVAVDMSPDAMHIATLSAGTPQHLCIWEWTSDSEDPVVMVEVPTNDRHSCVRFNTDNDRELLSNGVERVVFWQWDGADGIEFYSPGLSEKEFRIAIGQVGVLVVGLF